MAGQRKSLEIRTQNSLDFELESKIGVDGPFTPTEWLIVFAVIFALSGITVLVGYPWLRGWGIFSILVWGIAVPKGTIALKKNKSRSWIFDLSHRFRIIPIGSKNHFVRPLRRQVYDGRRRLVRSAWTGAKRSVMIPSRPEHLTIGLPAIQIWDPINKKFRRSITPQLRSDGYSIMNRAYMPGKSRFPQYWRNATIGRDESGKAVIEDYVRILTRWKPSQEGNNP